MQKKFDAISKTVFCFCNAAFPESLSSGMKGGLTYGLLLLMTLVFIYFRQWVPVWAQFTAVFALILFNCLYIRGHNLLQAEAAAKNAANEISRNFPKNRFKGPK